MDKQQFNIFDIDSALDRLEENLFTNNDEKIISTSNRNQQHEPPKQKQLEDDNKENGNLSLSQISETTTSITTTTSGNIDDEQEERNISTDHYESTSETFQPINTASMAADKTLTNSSESSLISDDDSSASNEDDDFGDGDHKYRGDRLIIPLDDSSKQHLISEESSNPQSLTNDKTLTKTVPLTELEPDIESQIVCQPDDQFEQKQCDVPQEPIVVEKLLENDVSERKEMSVNNLDTMDDISDAELESLEQELEELVQHATSSLVENSVVSELTKPEPSTEEGMITETKEVISEPSIETPTNEIEPDSQQDQSVIETQTNENDIGTSTEKIESSVSEAHEAVEPAIETTPEIDPVVSTSSTDESTSIQNLPLPSEDFSINESNSTGSLTSAPDLGRVPPYWIPDNLTNNCMQCDLKFTVIRRRHHCRACGLLLCSSCCSEKHFLHYLATEGRICSQCNQTLIQLSKNQQQQTRPRSNPNPANPMEYCSVIPPQQQIGSNVNQEPPTVMVPSGVLKRGPKSSERKSVIFSDGIRPGDANLADLDPNTAGSRAATASTPPLAEPKHKFNTPKLNEKTNSFILDEVNDELPPVLLKDNDYRYVDNNLALVQRLRQEQLRFAINKNFFITCKIVTLICCTNKTVVNFSTSGLLAVRQDEIMILLELNDDMTKLPKEVFLHLMEIYNRADKGGSPICEYGHSQASSNNFLGAFGGFLYIKPTFQCLQSLSLPEMPYLIGLLVHRWEIPWARLFPLRLILRLGATYRYYPTAILSNTNREPVFAEIGNTVMNFLADFRSFSYTIETIRAMHIHMEDRKTSVKIPKNRYDQVMKAINNSSDHLLAFGADFSKQADGHLVCIQNIDSGSSDSNSYSTQAINIQGQTRIRTGASFIIFNGALKQKCFKAKCSIVEDGIMVQILPTKMQSVRDALKNMKNVEISCGLAEPVDEEQKEIDETVTIEWVEDDLSFNVNVLSPIDLKSMEGKESVRTKLDLSNQNHIIRFTEVFLLESDDDGGHLNDDHLNYTKIAEAIARSSCQALLPFIDLMAVNQLRKIGIRVTLGENINYSAGSNNMVLSPIYMNALDNELISLIHRQASNMSSGANLTMELIFYILNK